MHSPPVVSSPEPHHALERTAHAAHDVVDRLADQALTGVGKVSGTLHVVVNRTADVISETAGRVAQMPVQFRQTRSNLAAATFAVIKARPFVTLGGAIALGFLVGQLRRR